MWQAGSCGDMAESPKDKTPVLMGLTSLEGSQTVSKDVYTVMWPNDKSGSGDREGGLLFDLPWAGRVI